MEKLPSFFSFFEAETDNLNMKIPIAFTQCIEKPFSEKVVFLRDRHNRSWIVKMIKLGDHFYFVDGWGKFVSDSLLTSRDLLLFSYFHENIFNVKVYGLGATEKNIRGQLPEDDDDNGDDNDINNDRASGQEMTLWRLYPNCYGMEIFEAGLAEKPKNPYFVAKLMPKRTCNLFIPRYVVNDHGLTIGQEIILVDPNGIEFLSKCKQWRDGRFLLKKGWAPLCRVNSISENDKCICEFVKKEGDDQQYLHISFVRNVT